MQPIQGRTAGLVHRRQPSPQKLHHTHSALMVQVDCAANKTCTKLLNVLVDPEKNPYGCDRSRKKKKKQSMHAPSHQQSGPRIAHQAWSAASGTTAAMWFPLSLGTAQEAHLRSRRTLRAHLLTQLACPAALCSVHAHLFTTDRADCSVADGQH